MLSASANLIVRTLLAPVCAGCRVLLECPLSSPVCPACWLSMGDITPPVCVRCGDALASWRSMTQECARCRRATPRFAVARSAGRYEGALRQVLHTFKYGGRRILARPLAQSMRRAGAALLTDADAVVPVPLHPWRALRRGFNQSDDLARELGRPVWRVLRRRRLGAPQAGLPAARRHANVRGAFAFAWPTILPVSRLQGSVVVLIDDVMTTGATADACSRVLLEAGVSSVRVLTAARAAAAPHA